MKRFLLVVLVLLIGAYVFLAFVGIEPQDRRPGTKLSGTERSLPSDWSFTDDVPEVHLETLPWFGVPFSVTVVNAVYDGQVYVPSLYESPMAFPGTKYWNHVVEDNPDVRLRVGDAIYPMQIAPVTDDAEFQAAFAAFQAKYPFWRDQIELDGRKPRFALLRLSPRS